jgi:perosamine synthetase
VEYKYPVAKPSLRGNELAYLTDAIEREWISSNGKYVQEFEKDFAAWNGFKYGVACSSGTNALILALRALGIDSGEEVIVPEFTMIASAWAVDYAGGKPIFVDCKDDLTIDTSLIEKKITSKTKAIMPVHIYGRQCNMDKIRDISYNYNLDVIEDSAEAHGVKPEGDIACFSLYANKIITSGEGGICVTNSERLAKQMEHLRAMAFTPQHDFLHPKRAYNFRMTDMQGAVALSQFERMEEFLAKRAEIERIYDKGLSGIEGITIMPKRNVLWMYDLLVNEAGDREDLQKYLEEKGIETRKFFKPMSQQPMYFNADWEKLNATRFSQTGLYLPTYVGLTEGDQEEIIGSIKSFYDKKN